MSRVTGLTAALMKNALRANQIDFSARARVPELLTLYQTIPVETRRAFELENHIINVGDDEHAEIENLNDDIDEQVGNNSQPDEPNRSDVNDESDESDDIDVDAELELLKKKKEILALRQEIRRMRQQERADVTADNLASAVKSAVQNVSTVSAAVTSPPITEVNVAQLRATQHDVAATSNADTTPITIADLPVGVRVAPYPADSPRAVIALPGMQRRPYFREFNLTKFTGEDPTYDVTLFFRLLENQYDLIQADDLYRLQCLQFHLDKAASTKLDKAFRNYGELKAALFAEFGSRATPASIEAQMRERIWDRSNESLHHFVLIMEKFLRRLLADRLSVQESIDLIINNMRLPRTVDVLLRNSKSTEELKDGVVRHAAAINSSINARANAQNAGPSNVSNRSQSNVNRRGQPAAGATGATPADSSTEVRCFNCSRRGHYKGQCPYELRPDGVCFKCWLPGHLSNGCQNKKRVQRLLTEVAAIHPDGHDDYNSDQDDPDAATEGLASLNLVSVAFRDHLNQYTGFTNYVSLFDTGSPNSFVRRSALPYTISDDTTTMALRGVGGNALKTHGTIVCNMRFNRRTHPMKLIILPDDATRMPMILGRDFLQLFGIKLMQPKLEYNRTKLLFHNKFNTSVPNETYPRVPDANILSRLEQFNLLRPNKPVMEKATPHRSINGKLSLTRFDSDYGPEFSIPQIYAIDVPDDGSALHINGDLPPTDYTDVQTIIEENYLHPKDINVEPMNYEMDIHLTSDVPFHYAPRRLSYMEKLDVQQKICEMIEEGIITPSDSPYASAIVLVKKKNGETRMCIDYRTLNKLTVRDNYPLPLIDDCVDYMEGKKYFSLLDLKSGFHQVKVSEKSQKFTSFVTPHGQYEYRRMPFGLKNAPAVFQRFVNHIFRDFLEKGEIIIYMDDILLASKDLDEHKDLLKRVLRRLAHRGLLLNLKKCSFCCEEIDYLGYAVNSNGIRPSNRHIAAMKEYPMPRNARELRSCIGLFSYFRRFVPNFSRIARPMQNLLKENVEYNFDQHCKDSFFRLRDMLSSSPILAIYNPKRDTELHCDASSLGFGAILMQKQDDGSFHPTAFFSKATTASEAKYHSFELETMAVLYALERFRIYLEGIEFVIVTDCIALQMALDGP